MRTSTPTLIDALRKLAVEIQSERGVANAAISEAADRMFDLWTAGCGVMATWHPRSVRPLPGELAPAELAKHAARLAEVIK